ncbi:hypothetical protein NT6N_16620 [Oceaniferula spumae]|uniref:Uncharacterized protein n=1 Tax=Oceaniferula spumae TaxID=2979115 RepID=A0AAT9FKJ6_9BACT
MNPSDATSIDENQIRLLFEEAGLLDQPVPDEHRVENIMERAMHDNVIRDLASFMFEGFPAVVDGVLSISTGKINHPDHDYRA